MTVSRDAANTKRYPLWLRLVGLACAIFTTWHIFATFLWIAPANEIRKVVPDNALRNYMMPMFGQSWSVFAPKPVDGDYSFEVRATLAGENGKELTTEWVDSVSREMDMTHHNLFPPRASLAGDKLSSEYQKSWRSLNEVQKESVELGFFKGDDWTQRLSNRLTGQSTQKSKGTAKQTQEYLLAEKRATAYATQIARAKWGDNVVRVQYRAGRQGVVPFSQRNNDSAKRPQPVTVNSGWRGVLVMDGQDERNFAKTFNSLEPVKEEK